MEALEIRGLEMAIDLMGCSVPSIFRYYNVVNIVLLICAHVSFQILSMLPFVSS